MDIRLLVLAGAAAAVVTSGRMHAQALEVTPFLGYSNGGGSTITRSEPVLVPSGVWFTWYSSSQTAGLMAGTAVTHWFPNGLGLGAVLAISEGKREVRAHLPYSVEIAHDGKARRTILGARAMGRLGLGERVMMFGGAGVFQVRLGGEAYRDLDDRHIGGGRIASRSFTGASLAAGTRIRFNRVLSVQIQLEDYMYRVTLEEEAPSTPVWTPMHHELVLTMGLVIPIRR